MQRERQKKEVEVLRQLEAKEMEEIVQRKMKAEHDVGCTWGFGTVSSINSFILLWPSSFSLVGQVRPTGENAKMARLGVTSEKESNVKCRFI